ncbi:MAG: hypothetical protein AAGL24_29965 [Pseudomonadota bacterium]
MITENEMATIADLRDRLSNLVDDGLGDLPVMLIVAPDSTLQALARRLNGEPDDPAIMIEFDGFAGRQPITIMAVDRME